MDKFFCSDDEITNLNVIEVVSSPAAPPQQEIAYNEEFVYDTTRRSHTGIVLKVQK